MKKSTYYFSHDYNASNDVKILFMRQQLGMEGYGIYWFLIEHLADAGGSLPLKIIPVLSMQMHSQEVKVRAVISEFDLFRIEENDFFSVRLIEHLNVRKTLSNSGKLGAKKRWNSQAIEPAISHPYAKESKVNKIKVNKIINTNNFNESFLKDWNTWIDYKKTNHKFTYKTIESEQIAFNHLYKLSNENEETARQIINLSIANGYKGLFELKTNNNAKPTNQQLQDEYTNRWANGMPELDDHYNLIKP